MSLLEHGFRDLRPYTKHTFSDLVARDRKPLIDSPFAILVTFGIPWLRRTT